MKLYLASMYNSQMHLCGNLVRRLTPREKAVRVGVADILESYHYVYKDVHVEHMRRDGARIFLDSGAFSAFSLGATIDLQAYCDYVHRNADLLDFVSVLDGIGDPLQTFKNQAEMERRGVNPLPCFHYGEDPRYLQWYMDRYPYITIGGMVPIAKPELRVWLDEIWSKYLTDSEGFPKVKVHGFGLTTTELMLRYPWYSVDSSTWVARARTGSIHIPGMGDIPISADAPQRREHLRHYDTMAPAVRERIRHEIESRGFDVERMRVLYLARWTFNMLTYPELAKSATDRFKSGIQTFF